MLELVVFFEGTNEINRLTVAKMLMKQIEQLEDTEVESDVANVERNHRYILLAKKIVETIFENAL